MINFHEKLILNYAVMLKICFSEIFFILYNIMRNHITKLRIDIISFEKVTGGAFVQNTALSSLLLGCEYLVK